MKKASTLRLLKRWIQRKRTDEFGLTSTTLPRALQKPSAYPHPVSAVKLIETHMSWVFLTGKFVYKVKKPVLFDFVDFSSLVRRKFFCEEEVRCNKVFAPDLYLGVVAICQNAVGELYLAGPVSQTYPDPVVEYAVHMLAFDESAQADRLLKQGELTQDDLYQFGIRLAQQHAQLPCLDLAYTPGQAILENFLTLRGQQCTRAVKNTLDQLEAHAQTLLGRYARLLQKRHQQQWVRECHGDLHLSNMVRLPAGLTAFDCLEFDQDLRNIDVWADAGFLFMDCCVKGRGDLGYAFVDGYLNGSGDYVGVQLLPMFAAYRSVVRAKIAALRYEQAQEKQVFENMQRHLAWASQLAARPPGRLWVTCGYSGSGKSYWAKRLVPHLHGIRLRSDVWRKAQHGLLPLSPSHSDVGEGLYGAETSQQVYESLAELATQLLKQGEHVLVDAASLAESQRQTLALAAAQVGAQTTVLHFTAPKSLLLERIAARAQKSNDPSEADADVLDWQMANFPAPNQQQQSAYDVVSVDTTKLTLTDLLDQLKV